MGLTRIEAGALLGVAIEVDPVDVPEHARAVDKRDGDRLLGFRSPDLTEQMAVLCLYRAGCHQRGGERQHHNRWGTCPACNAFCTFHIVKPLLKLHCPVTRS